VLRLPAMVRELKGHLKVEASAAPVPDAKAENSQPYYEQSRAGTGAVRSCARSSRRNLRATCGSDST
jgi:hypothetical protein